ncbi:ABC transporter substrate-binding protein [Novosphingobium sp. 9U]|uniref:ABC transporter substrate-binding protein n=1 Tax=Novosphingobium sp. 9U TaxID=2653158 RepID=UPI00135B511B|nr:ABC transporter substrate-binding protein [Novosphingobium sp. 9U]
MRSSATLIGLAAVVFSHPARARADEKVTYLLPAPKEAIVLAPFVLAETQGRYRKAKLDVRFVVVPGGFHVGEALARGEGDLGGASGDTPILLRNANLPVKGVALLGHHSFLTLITRQGQPATGQIDVPSLQDTSYYALQNLSAGSPHGEITTRARPPAELIKALSAGEIDGFVGTVDWGVKAERAGVQVHYRPVDAFYPAMAQAIMASDTTIAARPKVVRKFVRATMQALKQIAIDPEQSAGIYERAMPGSGYGHAEIVKIFRLLASQVYGTVEAAGRFNARTVDAAQGELIKRKLVTQRRDAGEFFTNAFTGQ